MRSQDRNTLHIHPVSEDALHILDDDGSCRCDPDSRLEPGATIYIHRRFAGMKDDE